MKKNIQEDFKMSNHKRNKSIFYHSERTILDKRIDEKTILSRCYLLLSSKSLIRYIS